MTARDLATLMVGSELPSPEARESTVTTEPVLDLSGLTVRTPDGRSVIEDVTFTIHKGEVVGIAGVEGNGQAELVEAIMGMRPSAGAITLDGTAVGEWSTRRRREAGVGYIPEDRHRHGLLLDAPLWENRMLGHQTEPPNCNGPLLDIGGARRDTQKIVKEYDVRTPSIDVTAGALSGGNQQKLIVGREMSHSPKVLIASHPTRGVDVGAQASIWDSIREARRSGMGVLLISADLDELIGLSDALKVMYRGRLVADADPATVTPEQLGLAMTGAEAGVGGGGMRRLDVRRILPSLIAPVAAILLAAGISSLVLLASGKDPFSAFAAMFEFAFAKPAGPDSMTDILNRATSYYIAAIAVAIGFRMGLFNIGVDGQYRLATLMAGALGAASFLNPLPGPVRILLIIIVAMAVGAAWAGIAALLKIYRGISEVISTIMLNFIAGSLFAYLLTTERLAVQPAGSQNVTTPLLPPDTHMPGIPLFDTSATVFGFIVVAVADRLRLLVPDRPDAVRLRPAGHRHEPVRRGRERRQRPPDGADDHAPVGSGGRAWSACRSCSAGSTR